MANIVLFASLGIAALMPSLAAAVVPSGSLFAYVPSMGPNTVSVIDLSTNTVTTTISLPSGSAPAGVTVNPAGTKVYIGGYGSGNVYVIDTSTNTITATIAVGNSPIGLASNLDGSKVYVANGGSTSVSVIDTATNTVTATIPQGVGSTPYGVAFNPTNNMVYVTLRGDNIVRVIDAATDVNTASIAVGANPQGVAFNPINNKVYVSSGATVSVIDLANNNTVSSINMGLASSTVTVNPVDGKVYVNSSNNAVLAIHPVTNVVSLPISGFNVPGGLSVTPDGSRLYVVNQSNATVSVVDTATNALTGSPITVGTQSYAIGNFIANVPPPGFTVTASPNPASGGGVLNCRPTANTSATPAATTIVASNATATCTATPDVGYYTTSISGCSGTATASNVNTYVSGTVTANCTVTATFAQKTQAIACGTDFSPNKVFGTAPFTAPTPVITTTPVGEPNGGTFYSVTSGPCSVNGDQITATGAGTCNYTANLFGTFSLSQASSGTCSVVIAKANQTVTFTSTAPAAAAVAGATYTATAASSVALTPVTITVDAASAAVCSIANGVVGFTAAGTCKLLADQAGNGNYNAATQATQSFTVGKGTQAILNVVANPTAITFGGTPSALSSSGGSGTGAVTYSVQSGPCAVTGASLSATGAGTCNVVATKAADANYNAVTSQTITVTVNKANQTVAFTSTAPAAAVVAGATYTATASATSGLAASITVDPTSAAVCSVSNGVVSFIGAGACKLLADQAGNGNYNAAAQATQSVTVGKGTQAIACGADFSPNKVFGAAPFAAPSATVTTTPGSLSAGAISYGGGTAGVCTVSGGTITATGAGTCNYTVDAAPTANLAAAPQKTCGVTVAPLGNAAAGGVAFTGTTATGTGAASMSFTTADGGPGCTLDPSNTAFVGEPAPYPVQGSAAPHGFFKFKLVGCTPGFKARVSVTWPALSPLMTYVKYGKAAQVPTAADAFYAPQNLVISGNVASFDVTDGAWGDNDLQKDGTIIDPSGPEIIPPPSVPTLNQWLLMLLALTLGLGGWARMRRVS